MPTIADLTAPAVTASAAAELAAALHAACERINCDECGDDLDACEITHSDDRDQNECGDCQAAADRAAEDAYAWFDHYRH